MTSPECKLPDIDPYFEKCGKGTAYIGSMIKDQLRAYGEACRQQSIAERAQITRDQEEQLK